ncbi:tRNA (guanosine(37)-N1)-methyltransferase TrmD [bacterium CPR1]|nr:tRNA (guanosine(37)-N1)-methyltransferase TrmD [bacterium CPR1]
MWPRVAWWSPCRSSRTDRLLRLDVLTLFPEIFAPLFASIPARAQQAGLVAVHLHNLRQWGVGRHRQVDDTPYGGGPGMVLLAEPLFRATEAITALAPERPRVLLMSPQGPRLDQAAVFRLARESRLLLVCGHYEGLDERYREALVDEEVSIGDYVLSGGELAAMVLSDALIRVQPGAIDAESVRQDSFAEGLLDHPHYSRPATFRGMAVPPVLLSGNHAAIEKWRREQALVRTAERRPDLLSGS